MTKKSNFYEVTRNYFWKIKKTKKGGIKIQFLFFIIWKIINSEVRSLPHKNFFEKLKI